MKKNIRKYALVALIFVLSVGVTYAAFADKGSVLGSSFSVGSADLKLLIDLSGGTDAGNLAEDLAGPSFDNISPYWVGDYLVKVFNNGTSTVSLTSNADYQTVNDPQDIRQVIYVEPFEWNDANNDGVFEEVELGLSLGVRDTLVKYKTVGYTLGTLDPGEVRGYVLRFSTENITDTYQGATGIFDFEFDSVGL